MDKVILVMDDPKYCGNCPLARERIFRGGYVCGIGHDGEYGDYIYEKVDMDSETKPDWCPLKELPRKKLNYTTSSDYINGFGVGYNTCVDEILGQ